MQKFPPLFLKSTLSIHHPVEPDDIMTTKRSLQRLGHYDPPDSRLHPFTDNELFTGIRSFQNQRGIRVDGLMEPEGDTATEIGRLLAHSTPLVQISGSNDSPSNEECDHLFWLVDIPTCRAIEARRGKRAAARCYHSAAARYAACLRGTPMNELPPLDVWNN